MRLDGEGEIEPRLQLANGASPSPDLAQGPRPTQNMINAGGR
jgi:hypothetical protein